MKEIVFSALTGIAVGFTFALLKLPVPAPPTLSGLMGIIGIFLGYIIAKKIF